MQLKLRTLLLVLPLVVSSCSDTLDTNVHPGGMISVTVGSDPRIGIQSESRTAIESDGQTIRWNTGDKIALWAVNAENQMIISAQTFDLWHYNATYNAAKFTATIPAPAEGSYNYYAASPLPTSVNGTEATYSLPAIQEFKTAELGATLTNLPYDIMVADPVVGKALVEGDNNDNINLAFHHKVHLIKVTVESNGLGQKVSEVALTFPSPVVGTLTVDVANPNAEPVLTDGSNTLIIRFDEPVEPGTTVIAAIAPIDVPASENVQIVSYGETHESLTRNIPGKNFAAGRTTPLFYNIPTQGAEYTRLSLSLPADKGLSTLGEEVQTLRVITSGDVPQTMECTVDIDGNGIAIVHPLHNRSLYDKDLSGTKITVEYDSENAIVSSSVTLPQITHHTANTIEQLSVPYLFSEDFSSAKGFNKDDNPGVGGTDSQAGEKTIYDLSIPEVNLSPGWTATRIGIQAGTALRICGRWEGTYIFVAVTNRNAGRVDSAPLKGIKPGKSIKVNVSYKFKGSRYSVVRKNIFGGDNGGGNGNAVYSYGYTYTQGGQTGGSDIEYSLGSDVVLPKTTGGDRTKNQTYTDINQSNTYTIPNATDDCRLSWKVSSTMDNAPTPGANGNFWLYLDDIQVSITK